MKPLPLALLLSLSLLAGDRPQAPAAPALTPHHESMKALEGTWDAEIRSVGTGSPEQVSKGTETVKLVSGGLWAAVELRADVGGVPYEGHGLLGYDPAARKHVGAWVDSMATTMGSSSGRCDGQCRRIVFYYRGPDRTGRVTDFKEVAEVIDADHRTMELSCKDRKGRFVKTMTIAYTRRK
ncbi:MAG TPA: DUF1579 family protein [Holophagaceae bacterium]|nr:DUF1579 family protein [Holophagaceae bacterium]